MPLIEIHQTLHGYDRGHKELSSSIALDDESRAMMLILSDSFSAVAFDEVDTYLAAYPLPSISRFVLARTWKAGAGFRPGSVWTHSLVLDYKALALIPDLLILLDFLVHPNKGHEAYFRRPVMVDADRRTGVIIERDEQAFSALLQLYSAAQIKECIVPSEGDSKNEGLAMALWRQMWPSFRRTFSFVTADGRFPAGINADCSMRFSKRTHFTLSSKIDSIAHDGYLTLIDDLPKSEPTRLRHFLNRYAVESKNPRGIAPALAAIQHESEQGRIDVTCHVLGLLTQNESLPRLVRDLFGKQVSEANSWDEVAAAIRAFRNQKTNALVSNGFSWVAAASPADLQLLLAATQPSSEGEVGSQVFSAIALSSDIRNLAKASTDGNKVALLALRPEIVECGEYWPIDDLTRAALVERVNNVVTFGVNEALSLFGVKIGPQTLAASLRFTDCSQGFPRSYMLLLEHGEPGIRKLFADWVVSNHQLLDHIANSSEKLSLAAIDVLCEAEVRTHCAGENSYRWFLIVNGIINSALEMTDSIRAVVYATAVSNKDTIAGIRIASTVFDALQAKARNNELEEQICQYLEGSVPAHVRGWSVSSSLVRSAVWKWPVSKSGFGALGLANSETCLSEIIKEVYLRQGKKTLEMVLWRSDTPISMRVLIGDFLKKVNEKKLFWWW